MLIYNGFRIAFFLQCHFVIKLNLVVNFNPVIFLRINKMLRNMKLIQVGKNNFTQSTTNTVLNFLSYK